jgi:hypothetical protein
MRPGSDAHRGAGGTDPHPWPPRCTGNDGPVGVHPARRALEAAGGPRGTRRPAREAVGHRGRAILEDARAIVDRGGRDDITTRLRRGDVVETISEVEARRGSLSSANAARRRISPRGIWAPTWNGSCARQSGRSSSPPGPLLRSSACSSPMTAARLAMKAVDQIARSPSSRGFSDGGDRRRATRRRRRRGWRMRRPCSRRPGSTRETRLIEGRPRRFWVACR